ncbi:hypothetical protein B296_00037655, partial [Ensete ventricosum]
GEVRLSTDALAFHDGEGRVRSEQLRNMMPAKAQLGNGDGEWLRPCNLKTTTDVDAVA